MSKGNSLEDKLYKAGCLLLIPTGIFLFAYMRVMDAFFPEHACVLYSVFGLYCPGCGGTRAMIALFHGKLLLSLWYHPLVLYGAVIYGGFLLTQTWERVGLPLIRGWKFRAGYLYGALGLMLFNFLLKNILLIRFGIGL